MLLLVEIALTVWAWRRGWKGWALLPVGIALGAGFMIGVVIGLSGGGTDNMAFAILIDVATVAALIVMGAKGRRVATEAGLPSCGS